MQVSNIYTDTYVWYDILPTLHSNPQPPIHRPIDILFPDHPLWPPSPNPYSLSLTYEPKSISQMIYDFLTIHFDQNGINVTNFVVSTTFPKADLHDMNASVNNLVSKYIFLYIAMFSPHPLRIQG